MPVVVMRFGADGGRGLDGGRNRHLGVGIDRGGFAHMVVLVAVMRVVRMIIRMFVTMVMRVRMTLVVMMLRIGVMMFVVVMFGVVVFGALIFGALIFSTLSMNMPVFAVIVRRMVVIMRLVDMRLIGACALDHATLHAVATATTTARIAVARTAAVGAVFGFFFGFAMGALVGFDQGLTVGDRNLIIVGMDFAEGQEAVAVAAILDEGRLQRRLYARDLGEVDIAAELFALGSFEIKLFNAIAADHNDPGLLRVGGVDQHFVGHFGTLDGGGRVVPGARIARPGDATVHLIRG
jgi:hypothetical protein